MNKKRYVLMILDGWGIAPAWGGNAIFRAKTKCFDTLWKNFPSTSLLASGDAVGLPTNAPGNSEAGHLNIGAGHVVRQDITLIDKQIDNGLFFKNEVLLEAILHAKKFNSNLHLVGLLSKTGTHSHIDHLYALLKLCKENSFSKVFIHLFSDGRDSSPTSGMELAEEAERKLGEIGIGRICSISGRFFAMDRDNRWGRIARAYNMMTKGEGEVFPSAPRAFSAAYSTGTTDEFIEPCLIADKSQTIETISDNDSIIMFNFRNDRTKELISAFLPTSLPEFPDRKLLKNLYLVSFAVYDEGKLAKLAFKPEIVNSTLAEVLSNNNLTQFHIAETEKYPHVTYFLNGGVEKPFPGEKRMLVPSLRNVKTYDYAPKMSAFSICQNLEKEISRNAFDFYVANFANADMVGHTGNLEATTQAVGFVDECLGRIVDVAMSKETAVIICADHGNAEQMVNPRTGSPDTEHTTNPVPFILVDQDPKIKSLKLKSNGILASIAPTLLEIAGIEKPAEMANESLLIREQAKQ